MPLEGVELAAFLSARCGKLTGSRMKDAIAVLKNGTPAKARSDLIRDILAERMTGESVRHYVTPSMQFGLDTEPEGKSAYEAATGNLITECGVYDHPTIDNFAATPDGLLGSDGLFELKCPNTSTWVEWVIAGVVPEEHKPQMLAQCAVTGRRWVEFCAYDPRVRKRSPLFIRRYTPTKDDIARIEASAEAFLAEVERAWQILTTAAA